MMAFREFTGELDEAAPSGPVREFTGELDAEEPQAQATPEPSMGDVALNAVPKGIANLLHTPHMLTSLVLKGLSSIPGMEEVQGLKELGDRFARNGIMEYMKKSGIVDPAKDPQTGPQRIVDLAIQSAIGSAVIPGGGAVGMAKQAALGATSGAAAQVTKEATGSDLLASVVGLAAPVMTKMAADAVSRGAKNILLNNTAKMTLEEARKHGYVVEPSQVRQPTSKLETIAGKAAIAQEASLRNQSITNRLAARSLGLPDDTPLSMSVIEEVRKRAATPYQEVAKLIPGGPLQGLKVSTVLSQEMVQGPVVGMEVKTSAQRSMQPGLATGLKVTKQQGPPPTTGVAVREIRDDAGNLIGLKTIKQSEGTQGALEGMRAKVTSRGQDIPGPLEGYQASVSKRYGPDVPGPIQGMRVNVQEMRGGIPLEELKQARNDATAFYRHYDRSADPSSLKAGKAAMAKAHELEAEIEETVTRLGRPELVDRLRDARQLIARTHDVERALNLGDGNVSAQIIGRMFDQGRPLTGELSAIGKFAQAFPRVTRDASMTPPPGVSGTDAAMSAMLGLSGASASGSVSGLAAAGLPLLRNPARRHLLSEKYQEMLLQQPSRFNVTIPKSAARASSLMTGKTVLDNAEE